jgi:D-xylose transport system ATP-binding protein
VQARLTAEPLLTARGLSVSYGTVVALDRVDLDVAAGEVVALAGENGAGKSTLVRCLAGDVAPGAGRITFAGQPLTADPRLATRLGVAVVWQDLSLCDNLDIAANLLLGRERRRYMVSATKFHEQAARLLQDLGIRLPPTATPVSDLSGGQRQLVAVARAMRDRPKLLILDEPTASLGVVESARV